MPAKKGAGYTLEIEDILKSQDKWFRPIDVATAPDGSLFIADWYDPILGGAAAADANKGRIYRVAPVTETYSIFPPEFSTLDGAMRALKNANPETRFEGFQHLQTAGGKASPALKQMWKSENPSFRARSLWLLAKLDSDMFLKEALTDANVDICIAAIRAVALSKNNAVPYLSALATDDNVAVRREVAITLRYSHTPEAAELWVKLAQQYDGKDRWYLEALGIASDLHADLFFQTWLEKIEFDVNNKRHQDIVWRSRSAKALPLLAAMIKSTEDPELYERYFRAFDFHGGKAKTQVLTSLVGIPRKDSKKISALALQQMNAADAKVTSALRGALEDAVQEAGGTIAFINLVEKFSLKGKQHDLLRLAAMEGNKELGSGAVDLLLKFKAHEMLKDALHKGDSSSLSLLQSMKGKGSLEVIDLVTAVIQNQNISQNVRKAAVQVLGSSWPGEEKLLALVKDPAFEKELKPAAAGVLFNVYRSRIQREAAEYLPKPSVKSEKLPTIKQLLESAGDRKNGKAVFEKYCITCHKINDAGVKFGPELTQIGDKLSKDGLYRAILYPDEGVSYGYESTQVKLQDETEYMGIVASESTTELVLNLPAGTSAKYAKEKIAETQKDDKSLMPSLAGAMSEQELVDLVEYLSVLKRQN